VTYRILGSFITAAIAYGFTRKISMSAGIGAVDFVSKIGAYYAHEYAWHKLERK
jgi:uncharacterized membrane protein